MTSRPGRHGRFGHGQPQAEASIVKVNILETLLARHSAANLSAGDRALAGQMIEDSDNNAATSLWDSVGRCGRHPHVQHHGRPDPDHAVGVRQLPRVPVAGLGAVHDIAHDQIMLLRRLVEPNPLLTGAARNYALSLMENVTPAQRWGVSGGVPAQATVALKNGWLPLNGAATDWQINSEGSISGSGRDYLMAVLTTGNPDEQYGIDTISQFATMIWANLG